jgi:hypothetical protein
LFRYLEHCRRAAEDGKPSTARTGKPAALIAVE